MNLHEQISRTKTLMGIEPLNEGIFRQKGKFKDFLMKLFKKDPAQTNKYTSVELPSNGAKHFFFSKKALVRLGDKESIESTGMGFYDEELGQVIIHWYDSNLELMEIDNRNPEKCAHLMIPKITQAFLSPSSKSQSKRSSQS